MAIFTLTGLALGAGKLALGAGKAILGAGASVAKTGARTGASVASSMMKRKSSSKEVSIAKKDKSSISSDKLIDRKYGKEAPDGKSSGVSSIDKVLDEIDNSLFNMINLVADSSKLSQKESSQQKTDKDKKKKKMREGILESASSIVGKIGSAVMSPIKGFGEILKRYFGNIAAGALALFVINNWYKIMEWMKKGVDKIKEIFEAIKPLALALWDIGKWIVSATGGQQFVKDGEKLKPVVEDGERELKKAKEQMDKNVKFLEGQKKEIEQLKNETPEEFWLRTGEFPGDNNPPAINKTKTKTNGNSDLVSSLPSMNFDSVLNKGTLIASSGPLKGMLAEGVVTTYNIPKLVSLLKSVGATDEEAVRLSAIGMHESSGNPNARNTRWPDDSYGLFQINMLDEKGYMLGEERRNKYGITNADLLEPEVNARVALDILRTQGWGAWSTNTLVTPEQLKRGRESLNMSQGLNTQAPYDIAGGTTIIMMGGDNNGSSGGQEGSQEILPLPIPLVNKSSYTVLFKTALAKA